jgi:hypothetical protein
MPATLTNPNEFKGYPIDLLRGLAHLGPAMIDNADLYAAVREYNASAVEGGVGNLGPALLTKDATEVVRSISAHTVPASVQPPRAIAETPDADTDPWEKHDLDDLIALAKTNGVELPRTKTPGKVIALLEAAGVGP